MAFKFKQGHLVPSCITAFGLACGLFVIFKVNLQGVASYHMVLIATCILLVAAIADVLDGAVARAIRAESLFGLFFDSMSDAVTFGIAPCVVLLKTLSLEGGSLLSAFAIASAMVYAICGIVRLVRFNLMSENKSNNHLFLGCPIPAAALCVLSWLVLLTSPVFDLEKELSQFWTVLISSCMLLLLAYFMISRIFFPSLKKLRWKVPSFGAILLVVALAIFFFYGVLYWLAPTFFIFAWGYLLLGPFICWVKK